jgi:uncharacterized protein YegL
MGDEMKLRKEELVENPTARVPVCLCLDVSGSMTGAPIEELNQGVRLFFESLSNDEVAKYSAEVAVVTFGGFAAQKHLDFGSLASQTVPQFQAGGGTPLGAAVGLALDMLEARKKEYSSTGIDYYQPWLVLMTDGQPTDDISGAASRTVSLIENRKLTIFPIGIGPQADMSVLAQFSPKRSPLRLKGLNFREFFEWLSKSVSRVSQSIPGTNVPLDEKGIKGWSEL